MGITVSDIERKEFAYKGAGYDPYDVDQYLDQICDEMVAMQDKIAQLEKELEEAQREVEQAQHAAQPVQPAPVSETTPYAKPVVEEAPEPVPAPVARTSETLESILINAQRLADDAVENANRKADDMLGKAKLEAEEITEGARAEKERIEAEYADLKAKAQSFKETFLQLIEEHKALLSKQWKESEELEG